MMHALHGFLGTKHDFAFLENVHTHSLSDWKVPLKDFGKAFKGESVLLGYSLGGRLALHALLANPSLYKGAVIVSAHLGLKNPEERKKRITADQQLAVKLLDMPFQAFCESWDSQELFKGSPKIIRKEQDFDKEALIHALTAWSLGNQEDLQPQIEALSVPILYIAGSQDTKYVEIAKNLKLKSQRSKIAIVKETGHRIPWQSKEIFIKLLSEFRRTL